VGFLGLAFQAHTHIPALWLQLAAYVLLVVLFLFSLQH
jgi:hypothetical protein